jgi:hypothetical protein
MYSVCYFCPILTEIGVYQQIVEKFPNMKFHETPSGGCRVVPCRQADRRIDVRGLVVTISFAMVFQYLLANTKNVS